MLAFIVTFAAVVLICPSDEASCQNARTETLFAGRDPFAAVLLFDASGSMTGARIEACKAAGRAFVNRMGDSDEVALMSFAGSTTLHMALTSDKQSLLNAFDGIQASGFTAMWDALILAVDVLRASSLSNRTIVLVSDGADGSSTGTMSQASALALLHNVRIIAVGLGADATGEQLDTLAKRTKGAYYSIMDPQLLPDLFAGFVDSLVPLDVVGQHTAELRMTCYPQPARDVLGIELTLPENQPCDMVVYDLHAREVEHVVPVSHLRNQHVRLSVDAFRPGVYYLVLNTKDGRALTRSFLVHR